MATLVDLLSSTYAPIQTMILPYLGIAEVIALTRTSKGFDCILPVLKAMAWNINYFLGYFFSDPPTFRSIQGECGALLSGRAVRNFLRRSRSPFGDLMVFVVDEQRDLLISHIENDGYNQQESPTKTGGSIFTRIRSNGQELRLYMFHSGRAAIAQVLDYHSLTASMNIVSWNSVYALFPHTTFIKSESYLLRGLSVALNRDLVNLTEEGIKTQSISWAQRETLEGAQNGYESLDLQLDQDANDIGELTRRRRIGDKHTWKLDLDIQGLTIPDVPVKVLESTTFRLHVPHKYDQTWPVAHYEVDFDTKIQHPVLRYQYVTLREDTKDDDHVVRRDELDRRMRTSHYSRKCEELIDRLNELTMIEFTKIPSATEALDILIGKLSRASRLRGQFVLPASWTFYDDEVISFLDKAWKSQQKMDAKEEASRKARFEDHLENDENAKQVLYDLLKKALS